MENDTIGKISQPFISGMVIIKKSRKVKDESHTHNAYEVIARMKYQSAQERRKIITMLCGKWHVDNVRVFCSVIPD